MIYLDYNATAPIRPEVSQAMYPYLSSRWGNPSSSYSFGSSVKSDIANSRELVGALIGAAPDEVLFTASATESNNTAFFSALSARPAKKHIVISAVEHSAVLAPTRHYESIGYRITRLAVDALGRISLDELTDSIKDDTALVSLMWANNETGVIFPIAEIAAVCREKGVVLHCDAAQAFGKLPIDVNQAQVDYLSLSAHKIGGPKGVGGLYVRRKVKFTPQILGGHQELGRRGGTENVPAIIGFATAAKCAIGELPRYSTALRPLRDRLELDLLNRIPGSFRNGDFEMRLPNTANLSFPGAESDALLLMLDRAGVCASAGSACLADSPEPSHVLTAMRGPRNVSRDNLRISIGLAVTENEIEAAARIIANAVFTLRDLGSNRF